MVVWLVRRSPVSSKNSSTTFDLPIAFSTMTSPNPSPSLHVRTINNWYFYILEDYVWLTVWYSSTFPNPESESGSGHLRQQRHQRHPAKCIPRSWHVNTSNVNNWSLTYFRFLFFFKVSQPTGAMLQITSHEFSGIPACSYQLITSPLVLPNAEQYDFFWTMMFDNDIVCRGLWWWG